MTDKETIKQLLLLLEKQQKMIDQAIALAGRAQAEWKKAQDLAGASLGVSL